MEEQFNTDLKNNLPLEEIKEKYLEIFFYSNDYQEKTDILNLLFNMGCMNSILKINSQLLLRDEELFWPHLTQALSEEKKMPKKQMLKDYLKGIEESDQAIGIASCYIASKIISEVDHLRKRHISTLQKDYKNLKEHLFEKLTFFQDNLLIDKEKELLEDLLLEFPHDSEIIVKNNRFKEKWAKNLITKTVLNKVSIYDKLNSSNKLNSEEKEYVEYLCQHILQKIKPKQSSYKDIAMLFFYMGGFKQALVFLDRTEKNLENLWFKAEIMLKANRYIDCLSVISDIENSWSHLPEVTFSTVYLKALAYWGTNQKALAIELLNSLVKVKPNYRSAQVHLNNWKSQ